MLFDFIESDLEIEMSLFIAAIGCENFHTGFEALRLMKDGAFVCRLLFVKGMLNGCRMQTAKATDSGNGEMGRMMMLMVMLRRVIAGCDDGR